MLNAKDASGAPTPSDPLGAAKRDYAAIEEAKTGVQPGKAARPQQSMPTLEVGTGPEFQRPAEATRKNAKKTGQRARGASGNWLLDGMAAVKKSDANQKSAGEKGEPRDFERASKLDDAKLGEELVELGEEAENSERTESLAKTSKEREKRVETAPNPLNNYMASWMTPRDLELLQPKGGAPGAAPVARRDISFEAPNSAISGSSSSFSAPLSGFGVAQEKPKLGATNPYLSDFAVGTGNSRSLAAALAPVGNVEPARPALQPSVKLDPQADRAQPSPPTTPTRASETLQAHDDAKYFKQLKRF